MDEYDPSHLTRDVRRSSMHVDDHHVHATRHCNVVQTSRALPFPSSPSLSIAVLRCPSLFIVVHHFLHRCLSISSSWYIDVSYRWCGSAFGWIGTSLRFRLEFPPVSHLQSTRQWIPFATHPTSAGETTPTATNDMDDRAHARLAPPLAKRKAAQEERRQEGDLQFALPAVEDVRGRSVRHVGIACTRRRTHLLTTTNVRATDACSWMRFKGKLWSSSNRPMEPPRWDSSFKAV